MKKISALVAAGLLGGLSSMSAHALNATGTFNVTINFTSSCSVNTAGLALAAFNYTSLQTTTATFGPLPFTVTCTNLAPYTVSLDAGGATYTGSYVAPLGTYTNTSTGLVALACGCAPTSVSCVVMGFVFACSISSTPKIGNPTAKSNTRW